MPITFVTKGAGGAGTDTLLGLLTFWMEKWTTEPLIVKVGGVRGPLDDSYPAELFKRFNTLDPDAMAKSFDVIANCVDRPVLVGVDPNLNLALIELLRGVYDAHYPLRFVAIHLLRQATDTPKILEHLRACGCAAIPATVPPPFLSELPSDVLRIPRLPPNLLEEMVSQKVTLSHVLSQVSAGTSLMLRGQLTLFFAQMRAIYE
jgi:hypothetical protein